MHQVVFSFLFFPLRLLIYFDLPAALVNGVSLYAELIL